MTTMDRPTKTRIMTSLDLALANLRLALTDMSFTVDTQDQVEICQLILESAYSAISARSRVALQCVLGEG